MSDPQEHTEDALIPTREVRLRRDAEGQVHIHRGTSVAQVGSMAMAFPLSKRDRLVVLRSVDGKEIGILDDIGDLDVKSRHVVKEELEKAYFLPVITDILAVDEDLGIVTWEVETDRGPRTFQVRSVRRNMRRLGRRRIIIRDVDGNRYDVEDWTALPAYAQKVIERYS